MSNMSQDLIYVRKALTTSHKTHFGAAFWSWCHSKAFCRVRSSPSLSGGSSGLKYTRSFLSAQEPGPKPSLFNLTSSVDVATGHEEASASSGPQQPTL